MVFPPALVSYGFRAKLTAQSDESLSLTNVQKLSLPANTPVGTQVQVTDGFAVSGFGDARDGFYFPYSEGVWIKSLPFLGDGSDYFCEYVTVGENQFWQIGSNNEGMEAAAIGSEANPWEADWSDIGVTLTHPAVLQLATPSTAQGGMFVSGGTQDGIYTIRGERYDKIWCGSLGVSDGDADPDGNNYTTIWWSPSFLDGAWMIMNGGGTALYYSLSDVDTPDLAGTDKMVVGRTGDGSFYTKRGTNNGKPYYNLIGEANSTTLSAIAWTGSQWITTNGGGSISDFSDSDVATPDLATWDIQQVENFSWFNAGDDTPAPEIVVTSVTQGELNAGVTVVNGESDPDTNDTYIVNGVAVRRNFYLGLSNGRILIDPAKQHNWLFDGSVIPSTAPNDSPAFPWQTGWNDSAIVTRNDVASEANWDIV